MRAAGISRVAGKPGLHTALNATPRVEPFLKWPGGKRLLIPRLVSLAPKGFGRYFEPFVGSGALFFALRPTHAVLSDTNNELIECYQQIKSNCEQVIDELRSLRNSELDYYRIRKSMPTTSAARAARFIYLVKLAFNGIYRVSRTTGKFNVPYGWRTQRTVFDEDRLMAASNALRGVRTIACDFEVAVVGAKSGDFVYFDPPYSLAHTNNGFVRYNQRLFSWSDQARLATCAAKLASKGVHVMVSNAPHVSVLRLYPGFSRRYVRRSSQIAADVSFRGSVAELILMANI
jgi:DNA adenine methylase